MYLTRINPMVVSIMQFLEKEIRQVLRVEADIRYAFIYHISNHYQLTSLVLTIIAKH